jgi:hypothetical protein
MRIAVIWNEVPDRLRIFLLEPSDLATQDRILALHGHLQDYGSTDHLDMEIDWLGRFLESFSPVYDDSGASKTEVIAAADRVVVTGVVF